MSCSRVCAPVATAALWGAAPLQYTLSLRVASLVCVRLDPPEPLRSAATWAGRCRLTEGACKPAWLSGSGRRAPPAPCH